MTWRTMPRISGTASGSHPGSMLSTDTEIAGTPRKAASRAAPTVPEYVVSAPMLPPALTPATTRPGGGQATPSSATRTQSDGVPSQARPDHPSPNVAGARWSARWMVMARATALALWSGARVVTAPRPSTAARSTARPGAEMPSSLVRRICRVTRSF